MQHYFQHHLVTQHDRRYLWLGTAICSSKNNICHYQSSNKIFERYAPLFYHDINLINEFSLFGYYLCQILPTQVITEIEKQSNSNHLSVFLSVWSGIILMRLMSQSLWCLFEIKTHIEQGESCIYFHHAKLEKFYSSMSIFLKLECVCRFYLDYLWTVCPFLNSFV